MFPLPAANDCFEERAAESHYCATLVAKRGVKAALFVVQVPQKVGLLIIDRINQVPFQDSKWATC